MRESFLLLILQNQEIMMPVCDAIFTPVKHEHTRPLVEYVKPTKAEQTTLEKMTRIDQRIYERALARYEATLDQFGRERFKDILQQVDDFEQAILNSCKGQDLSQKDLHTCARNCCYENCVPYPEIFAPGFKVTRHFNIDHRKAVADSGNKCLHNKDNKW